MKGLVFTEFLEMVERKFSPAMVDDIIDDSDLPSGGAYTAVGTYPHSEMLALVQSLSKETRLPVPALMRTFGRYLFDRYAVQYPALFKNISDAFDFLDRLECQHQIEVRKLYPDAVFPSFKTLQRDARSMIIIYRSHRPFAALAEGLIEGCLAYFNTTARIDVVDLSAGAGTSVEFHVTLIGET